MMYTEPGKVTIATATIADDGNLSTAFCLGGHKYLGIVMPGTWDAADITFQASHDGTTYQNLYDDDDNEVTIKAAVSRNISIKTDMLGLAPWPYIKIRSGTSGSPVNQTTGTTRSFTLIMKS